jgi:ribonucleoside-diphosphate reductase alpha chain
MSVRDDILRKRYLVPGETEMGMYARVAKAIANDPVTASYWTKMMQEYKFLPNSPTLVNAGSGKKGGFSACYVLPIFDTLRGITKASHEQALVHAHYGGTGFNLGRIRPRGDPVSSTGGKACGAVKVMHYLNETAEMVEQGGNRSGANMGSLPIWHPEIRGFIHSKDIDGTLPHFNISASITDDFILAYSQNDEYELRFNDKVYETVDATTLFEEIVHNAWLNGDPGLMFIDRMNAQNMTPNIGLFETTNPCVVGDTLIQTVEGLIPIKDLVGQEVDVYCVDTDKYSLQISKAKNIRMTRRHANLMEITTTRGTLICTPDHKIYTRDQGYVEAKDLRLGNKLCCVNRVNRNIRHIWDIEGKDVHHIDGDDKNNVLSNFEVLEHGEHSRLTNIGHECYVEKDETNGRFIALSGRGRKQVDALGLYPVGSNLRIISIKTLDYTEDVYDMEVERYHNFFANNILIHNCGEQPLLPYESCNLGSINLSNFVIDGEFIKEDYIRVIRDAVNMLNDIIDKNTFPLEEIRLATLLTRKIGLGVMGWHDMLLKLETPYCSDEAIKWINTVGGLLKDISHRESQDLAQEYGVFDGYEGTHWDNVGIRMHNATTTTIAPTGTLSFLAQCSSGIEPVFDWEYDRTSEQGTEHIVHSTAALAKKLGLEHETNKAIHWSWHMRHQEEWQKYIDNAVSKTINVPHETTEEEIYEIYEAAFKHNIKGLTVYRDLSKSQQVINTRVANNIPLPMAESPFTRRPASIYEARSGCGKMYIITGHSDKQPSVLHDVFIESEGGCTASNEAMGRNISLGLQEGIDPSRIASKLRKVKCHTALRSSSSDGKSCADIIGKCIAFEYANIAGVIPTHDGPTCPECGSPLNFGSGCSGGECTCGWSGCF